MKFSSIIFALLFAATINAQEYTANQARVIILEEAAHCLKTEDWEAYQLWVNQVACTAHSDQVVLGCFNSFKAALHTHIAAGLDKSGAAKRILAKFDSGKIGTFPEKKKRNGKLIWPN